MKADAIASIIAWVVIIYSALGFLAIGLARGYDYLCRVYDEIAAGIANACEPWSGEWY